MRYLIFLLLLQSCHNARQEPTTTNKSEKQQLEIIGVWCLEYQNEINYAKIEINKNGIIVLRSRADTIYQYSYKIQDNQLLIFQNATLPIKSAILKLTSDSLILANLLEKGAVQRYHKCQL
jgi:hypothetical protein